MNAASTPKSRPGSLLSTLKALGRMIREPGVPTALALRDAVFAGISPEEGGRLMDALRSAPGIGEMFASGYLAPAYRIEDLAGCAPGTLGEAYHRFMTANGFDAVPLSEPVNDLHFFSRRVEETHDLWHVALGYAPDLVGEIEILAFFLAHQQRSLSRERLPAARVGLWFLTAFLAHVARYQPRLLPRALGAVVRGARRGYESRPLWAVRWEEMWHRPLAEVQAAYVGAAA